jgi:hypothetical protein
MSTPTTEEASLPGLPPAVEGPSFPPAVRALATLMLAGLCVWGVKAAGTAGWHELGSGQWLLLGLAAVVIAVGYWHIQTCRTRIADGVIRQTVPWGRAVELADVTQVKLIRLPGLSALFVPRLVLRARGHGLATFHAGDATLLAAFRRLAHGDVPTP